MSLNRRRIVGGLTALALCILLLAVCDDRDSPQQTQQQREAQLQAEQDRRLEAQQAAHDAEASRNSWLTLVGAGACAACIIVLLIGIHIGSRALARYRKDHPHA